jgi:DNA repair exonuclease SbcCD ATPase subunit
MIIKKLKFKNISSYGNKLQNITFDENGGLILLSGRNGSGKSTIQNAIDICIFNTSRGKNLNRIPLKNFPNRINKNLYTNIEFLNQNNDVIQIERKISPNDFKIIVNTEDYTERFKLMSDIDRENLIGFNYQSFKSFISLSMNDFLNFINLKTEDKRNLLNRLFNLDEIDNYYSITKELINQNKKEIEKLIINITNIDNELNEFIDLIKKHKTNQSKNELKENILKLKESYELIENENNILLSKNSDYQNKLQENKNLLNSNDNDNIVKRTELNELRKKIKIFEDGKCPYCDSLLINDIHNISLSEMKDKEQYLITNINNNELVNSNLKINNIDTNKQISFIIEKISDNNNNISTIKSEILILKSKYENNEHNDSILIDDIKKRGILLKKEKDFKLNRIKFLKSENLNLIELLSIFDENGIRKEIIKSIIPDINKIMNELLNKINYPYIAKLNDNFDVDVYDKNELINSEVLSNGEIRMLNICVAISYIEIIRKFKKLNIIFMDEVFQSIDKENINNNLILLKEFAIRNKINLFLVHHGLEDFDLNYFYKIIKVNKKFFSDLSIN